MDARAKGDQPLRRLKYRGAGQMHYVRDLGGAHAVEETNHVPNVSGRHGVYGGELHGQLCRDHGSYARYCPDRRYRCNQLSWRSTASDRTAYRTAARIKLITRFGEVNAIRGHGATDWRSWRRVPWRGTKPTCVITSTRYSAPCEQCGYSGLSLRRTCSPSSEEAPRTIDSNTANILCAQCCPWRDATYPPWPGKGG